MSTPSEYAAALERLQQRFNEVWVQHEEADAHLEAAEDTIEKLVKALKAVEWTGESRDADYCPVCLRDDCAGHADDCIVGAAIKATRGDA